MTRLSGLGGRGLKATATILAFAGSLALASGVVFAQKAPKTAAKKKGPASAWVKLCEQTKLPRAAKGGKTKVITKDICLTHHERLDGNTGMVIISAAIRQVAGQKKPSLMVMVPLGMALPAGVKAAVYNKEQWGRAQKKKRVDDKELKPITLKYSLCHPAGCTAEIPAPDGLVDAMKKGGGLMVLSLNSAGRPVAFPVPLTGFTQAHTGKPVDGKKYSLARQRLMGRIRDRMRQRIVKKATAGRVPEPTKVKK